MKVHNQRRVVKNVVMCVICEIDFPEITRVILLLCVLSMASAYVTIGEAKVHEITNVFALFGR